MAPPQFNEKERSDDELLVPLIVVSVGSVIVLVAAILCCHKMNKRRQVDLANMEGMAVEQTHNPAINTGVSDVQFAVPMAIGEAVEKVIDDDNKSDSDSLYEKYEDVTE
eukprot:136033_1